MGIIKSIYYMIKEEFDYRKELSESYKSGPDELPQTAQEKPATKPIEYANPIKTQPISRFSPHTQVRADTYTVYYAYGHVMRIFPPPSGSYYDNRDIIYGADFIVSDGVAYNLTDKKSIYSIKTPNYHIYAPNKIGEELGVTGCLDYVLRMRSGRYWNEGNYDLAIACLEKATELMKYSSVGWPPKDFFRIVNELNDLGLFKKAQRWEEWIKRNIPGAASAVSPSVEVQMAGATKESCVSIGPQ